VCGVLGPDSADRGRQRGEGRGGFVLQGIGKHCGRATVVRHGCRDVAVDIHSLGSGGGAIIEQEELETKSMFVCFLFIQ